MPSPKSRETGFYYGNPRNRFFPVLAEVFDTPLPLTVPERKAFLLRNRIALWDILKECLIRGASDASIHNPVPNDIKSLLNRTQVSAVFTTGTVAFNLYRKFCCDTTGISAIPLPSPSPANCSCSFEQLCREYQIIRKYTL